MSQNLPLIQLPMPENNTMPNLPDLPPNLQEVLNVSGQSNKVNPNILRDILSGIQSGRNYGLPELAGEQRNATLKNLLGNIQPQQNAQPLPDMGSVYDNGRGQIVKNPSFELQSQDTNTSKGKYDVGRILAGALLGGLMGGPVGLLGGAAGQFSTQFKGNDLRRIYNELGFQIPENLPASRVEDYVKSSLVIRKEGREQQKANLDNLNTTLDVSKKSIELSTLPEKTKADLLKSQSNAEKAVYEAMKSGTDAQYADAMAKSKLALQKSQIASNYAIVPYRKALTEGAQAKTQQAKQTPLKPLSNEAANGLANALQGIESVNKLKSFAGRKDLYSNPNVRFEYENYKDNIYDILARLRTGAAISKTEEALYKRQVPTVEDFVLFPQQAQNKIETFNKLMIDKVKTIDPNGIYTYNARGKSVEQLSKPSLTREQALQLAKQRGLI